MSDRDKRAARIGALGEWQRQLLLDYLCGAVPEWVDRALGTVEPATAKAEAAAP